MIVSIIIFSALACVTGLVLTVLVRELAPRIGLTDLPDGRRKLHAEAMPLGGGLAVLLATISVVGVVLVQPNPFQRILWVHGGQLAFLVPAGLVIVAVGLIDDRFGLRGWHKLFGQVLAASILIYGGMVIERISVFGLAPLEFGVFAIPCTLFWLLGAINALNLLDGIDGLAAMMGIILAATIGVMAQKIGHAEVAIVAFVFAGSLVGFLRFNFPPASIFLGDTGSMLIGLVVGALAIQGSLKGPGTVLLAAPLAVWAIPIFDSAVAILRRKLTGRSIYATDRGHLHHRLLSLLGSNRKVLVWLAACCGLTSMAALLSVFLNNDLYALLTCSAIVVMFIATGIFGRSEVVLLGSHLRRVVSPIAPKEAEIRDTGIPAESSRPWELLWDAMVDSADSLALSAIRLDVDFPEMQETYHGSWERPDGSNRQWCWQLEFPLMIADRPVGRLVLVGEPREEYVSRDVEQVLQLVKLFETQMPTVSAEEIPVAVPSGEAAGLQKNDTDSESAVSRKHPK
jgi:UDP-GlcNAc:undecaprenyl-phosphate GlcNAc-1-phosphate transferase